VAFAEGVDPGTARVGDYASGTDIGLYLMAVSAAPALGLISRSEALERIRAVLRTLERLERHCGFFFNFYDTTSLERTSNLISFVDSSWLTASLMVVRTAFPELAAECSRWIDSQDYGFFYLRQRGLMSHGYWAHVHRHSSYHYGVLYSESRLGSLVAIGKGDVPREHWFRMVRTFAPACRWQRQTPLCPGERRVLGYAVSGGHYEWRGVRYVPSWGGSMFEALMPTLVLDELQWAPRSLGANGRAHVAVQEQYALEVLGYPVWGLSPCATPTGYAEVGVPLLGSVGYPPGPVTPHASALALAVDPDAATQNLRRLAELYDIYGPYGFYDAVDPVSGRVTHVYLTLDQAMIFLALGNFLGDRFVQRQFAADPIAQRVLGFLGAEDFFTCEPGADGARPSPEGRGANLMRDR